MPGPPPDPRAIRRNKENKQKTVIQSDGELHGFPLPDDILFDRNGELEDWHPATRRWWNAWRKAPQAAQMLSEPDWLFLLDTALIHHSMWKNQKWEFANELRMRLAKFGATPEDRARLRMEIELPDIIADASTRRGNDVTSITARKARMKSA